MLYSKLVLGGRMKNLKLIQFGVSAALTVAILSFNNCGKFESGNQFSSATQILQKDNTPVEPTGISVGAKIDAQTLIEFTNATGKSSEYQEYMSADGFKAIAVSEDNNILYVYNHRFQWGTFESQAEVNKIAIERCNIVTKRKCTILAENNIIKTDKSDLASQMVMEVAKQTAFNPSDVPGLNQDSKLALGEYDAWAINYKVLSLSINGSYAISRGTTLLEARRISLEFCESSSGGYPCFIYAENNVVVFNPTTVAPKTSLPLSGGTLAATKIPFLLDATRAAFFTTYNTQIKTMPNSAIAVASDGITYGYTTSNSTTLTADEIMADALKKCNSALTIKINQLKAANPQYKVIEKYKCHPLAKGLNLVFSL